MHQGHFSSQAECKKEKQKEFDFQAQKINCTQFSYSISFGVSIKRKTFSVMKVFFIMQ